MSSKSRKTRNNIADDQSAPVAPAIRWSEWTDAELNAEKWDVPKNGTDGRFLDSEPCAMPPSIEPHDWKRVSALRNFPSNPVVFTPSKEQFPSDFVKNNKHILHSEFVRWFTSTMINLEYIGREGLRVEGESPDFISPDESVPWQGWTYVYSLNKCGKSVSQHRPIVNPNGKYVIRLHFMGSWRRFIVDDMIPVDVNDTPLLPRVESDFELWPMLLAKAMMKLAALSWTSEREINDFYPVSCFTGWICLPLVAKSLSPNEKWQLLTKYVDGVGEVEMSTDKQSAESPSGKENTNDKKPLLLRQNSHPKVTIFANISCASKSGEKTVPHITPCENHPVHIAKLKDIGVETSQMRWKMYRYFDWATKHGSVSGPAARSLKLISPLKRYRNEGCLDESAEEETIERSPKVSGQVAKGVEEKPDMTIMLPEIGVWVDFVKISPYLNEILVFYKPSDFVYYARVSDLLRITTSSSAAADSQLQVSLAGNSRSKSEATSVKDGKKAHTVSASSVRSPGSFRSWLKWQENIPTSRNEFLYMLVDSPAAKFFLIDFSSMPERPSHRSYLIFERYNFFERSTEPDDDPAALIKTFGTGATIFEIEPGRHLYRVLFRSRNSYCARILSDTIFHLGDRFRIHDLMTLESDRIDAIARNIGNRITAAFQEFGCPGYASSLRSFYDSYMPREADMIQSKVEKKSIKNIHRLFIMELEKLIKEAFPVVDSEAICHALRVFFLINTTSYCKTVYRKKVNESTDISSKAAVKIQSFFRMSLIKTYKKIHSPSHVRHSEVSENLRKLSELFKNSERESVAHILIRKMISSTILERFPDLYPCRRDLNQVLNIEEWKGVLRNVQPRQWVPILRVVLNAPTPEDAVNACIDFSANLPKCVIRMMNNETYREVTRLISRVATSRYPYVKLGYTLIVYGWSEDQKSKELDWCVRVITIKGEPKFQRMSGAKSANLLVKELSNNYIPNVCKVIGKWTATIFEDTLLSFRLSTSYDMVESVLKISDNNGKVLCEAKGGSVLVLPAVYLSLIEKSANGEGAGDAKKTKSHSKSLILDPAKNEKNDTAEYHILASVANDSWPLTSTEWTVANEAKSKGTVYDPMYGRTSISSISKRGIRVKIGSRGSSDKLHGDGDVKSDSSFRTIFQDPFCKLQVLIDVGSKVQIEQDRHRETEIAEMKRLWEEEEPGRLLRGRELREEFLKHNSATISEESIQEPATAVEIRTLKPPASFPPWKIAAYVSKYADDDEEDERWLKTEGDEEMLRNQRAINLLDFEEAQAVCLEEEISLLTEQRLRYSNLLNSYVKKTTHWKSLASMAYEKRDGYVADVKSAFLSSAKSKTAKDTKTKTKTKGKKMR